MGMGLANAQLFLELKQSGKLKNVKKIAELGSQEIHIKQKDLSNLFNEAGLNQPDFSLFPDLDNWPQYPRCSTKPFYKLLGIDEYTSIDSNGEHGSIQHDWNTSFNDQKLFNQFDVVTDFGSAEHVFNIVEPYKTLHKLCKQGGLIVISQALWGGNGFFLMDRPFIDGIAAANNYKVISISYVVCTKETTKNGSNYQFHIPMNSSLIRTIDLNKVVSIQISAVMEKRDNEEFKIPYEGRMQAEHYGHFGYKTVFLRDDTNREGANRQEYYFLPVFNLDAIKFKTLIIEVFNRLKNKIFRS